MNSANDQISSSTPDKEALAATASSYQGLIQLLVHAEQERWAILYNFLTANTILILAWAALFVARMPQPDTQRFALACMAGTGFVISILWLLIETRANAFVRGYGELGEATEDLLGIGEMGAFHRGEAVRNAPTTFSFRTAITWGAHFLPSRHFLQIVPGLFAAVHLVFLVLSLVR